MKRLMEKTYEPTWNSLKEKQRPSGSEMLN
jgi:hypothetical protein